MNELPLGAIGTAILSILTAVGGAFGVYYKMKKDQRTDAVESADSTAHINILDQAQRERAQALARLGVAEARIDALIDQNGKMREGFLDERVQYRLQIGELTHKLDISESKYRLALAHLPREDAESIETGPVPLEKP